MEDKYITAGNWDSHQIILNDACKQTCISSVFVTTLD